MTYSNQIIVNINVFLRALFSTFGIHMHVENITNYCTYTDHVKFNAGQVKNDAIANRVEFGDGRVKFAANRTLLQIE